MFGSLNHVSGTFSSLSGSLKVDLQQIIAAAKALGIVTGSSPSNVPTLPLTTGSLGGFTNFSFPLIRRTWAPIRNQLIGIQPMSVPSGGIFYMDYEYGDPMNDPKLKFLTFDEMLKAGIMPWENNSHDMNKLLSELSPEEARKLRRKFRKLWRKKLAAKQEELKARIQNPDSVKYHTETEAKRLGLGQKKPTKEQRRRRREILRDEFVKNARERATKLKTDGTDGTEGG